MGTIGIEWVNKFHGRASDLKNNDDNARGFYNTLSGVRRFEYADDLAWDSDFEESGVGSPSAGGDQLYADNVDIVFFSGHGSINGAFFGVTNHDDGEATHAACFAFPPAAPATAPTTPPTTAPTGSAS